MVKLPYGKSDWLVFGGIIVGSIIAIILFAI